MILTIMAIRYLNFRGSTNASINMTSNKALTTPRKIRLPIGQPAGKNQVTPIKIQVAPVYRAE